MKIRNNIYKVVKALAVLLGFTISVSFIAFLLIEVSPIDPVHAFVRARGVGMTPEQKALLVSKWGLDKPFITRYVIWLGHFLTGDLGTSQIYEASVTSVIWHAFSTSAGVLFFSWVLQGVISVLLGISAAIHKGTKIDKAILGFCSIMMSTPSFWVAMLLIIIFSVNLGMFPIGFSAPVGKLAESISLIDRIEYMILPIITLVLTGVSEVCLHTRAKTIEVLNSEYVTYAISRGYSKSQIIHSYAIKNIILPAITLQFSSFGELFSGIILIETAFNFPGIGQISVKAGLSGDVPLMLGITVFTAVFVFVGNKVSDYLASKFDMRMVSHE